MGAIQSRIVSGIGQIGQLAGIGKMVDIEERKYQEAQRKAAASVQARKAQLLGHKRAYTAYALATDPTTSDALGKIAEDIKAGKLERSDFTKAEKTLTRGLSKAEREYYFKQLEQRYELDDQKPKGPHKDEEGRWVF